MRGATFVRAQIASYMEQQLPGQIALYREVYGLDEYQLPVPVKYDAYEPYALDRFPLMGVVIDNASSFALSEQHPHGMRFYRPNYSVQLFTWVRTPTDSTEKNYTPEYDQTARLRDDMAAVVRAVLLHTASFGNEKLFWNESSLQERYSDTTAVKGDRFVAGVTHSFTVKVDEALDVTQIGRYVTYQATVHAVGVKYGNVDSIWADDPGPLEPSVGEVTP